MNPLTRSVDLLGLGRGIVEYNGIARFQKRPRLPRALCLYVTYRCNMKCRICGIWRDEPRDSSPELTAEEFGQILADPLFQKLEFVNINGGEPNLRLDLPDIVRGLIRQFPRLKRISLNSNGLPPDRTIENASRIISLCRPRGIQFSVSLSLHKTGKSLDEISGVSDTYARLMKAFQGLIRIRRNQPFFISANCVISRFNIDALDEMLAWSRREGIPVNFTLGEVRPRFQNSVMAGDIILSKEGQKKLARFFRKLSRDKKSHLQHALRYARLAEMVWWKKERSLSCHYSMGGAILGSRGELYYCKSSQAIGDVRSTSALDIYYDAANLRYRRDELCRLLCQDCPPNTFNQMEVEKDILKILGYWLFAS